MTKEEIQADIQDGIKSWNNRLDIGIPVFYLYHYTPATISGSDYNILARHFIYSFSKGGENTIKVNASHIRTVLLHFFLSETITSMTFLCVPASEKWVNKKRNKVFSNLVSTNCNMLNGFDHIKLKNEEYDPFYRVHNIDNLEFDREWFKGKTIILFDIILDKKSIIGKIKDLLVEMGATVIGAIVLGLASKHVHFKGPFDDKIFIHKTKDTPNSFVTEIPNKQKDQEEAKDFDERTRQSSYHKELEKQSTPQVDTSVKTEKPISEKETQSIDKESNTKEKKIGVILDYNKYKELVTKNGGTPLGFDQFKNWVKEKYNIEIPSPPVFIQNYGEYLETYTEQQGSVYTYNEYLKKLQSIKANHPNLQIHLSATNEKEDSNVKVWTWLDFEDIPY